MRQPLVARPCQHALSYIQGRFVPVVSPVSQPDNHPSVSAALFHLLLNSSEVFEMCCEIRKMKAVQRYVAVKLRDALR